MKPVTSRDCINSSSSCWCQPLRSRCRRETVPLSVCETLVGLQRHRLSSNCDAEAMLEAFCGPKDRNGCQPSAKPCINHATELP